jgi:hypothetical protein
LEQCPRRDWKNIAAWVFNEPLVRQGGHVVHADYIKGTRLELSLNQSRPLGNVRFLAKVEQMTGKRREAKPRGRPRVQDRSVELAAVG